MEEMLSSSDPMEQLAGTHMERAYLAKRAAHYAERATAVVPQLTVPSLSSNDALRLLSRLLPRDFAMIPCTEIMHRMRMFREPKSIEDFNDDESITYIGIINTKFDELEEAWSSPNLGFINRMDSAEYRAYFDYLQRMVDDAKRLPTIHVSN